MWCVLRWIIVVLGVILAGGTFVGTCQRSHWAVRSWDFPRVQIAVLLAVLGPAYAIFFSDERWYDGLFLALLGAAFLWQCYKIAPYTPLRRRQVKKARLLADAPSVRLVMSNVLMTNRQYDHWLRVVRKEDPDLILAVETDSAWVERLEVLRADYPQVVAQPQENMYGMVLFSRLKLIQPQIRHVVQDDVPSIHTGVELSDGTEILLIGVHPRPPEPIRDQSSIPRDAELVVLARQIAQEERPTIILGDLNDVAWSYTTTLFLRISRLLDPRLGRGFFNTFDANRYIFRFPLDHVFHSDSFKLVRLERLAHVGSDHFPVVIELSYQPEAKSLQSPLDRVDGQREEARERIRRAEEQEGAIHPRPHPGPR